MTHTMDDDISQAGSDLVDAASAPDADPCDIACEAMPAHVAGDLSASDETWLHDHTRRCNYCGNELRRYDRLNEALASAGEQFANLAAPPPVALPRRERIWFTRLPSPLGDLLLAATPDGLREIEFGWHVSPAEYAARWRERGAEPVPLERIDDADLAVRPILQRTALELNEYFGGQRAEFDVPLDWGPMAPFQRAVLEATAQVPLGRVDTYAGIARKIGNPRATRAVGNALGRNPIPVIVPCHRVIRSDATLGGYTGGLGIKQRLLSLEGVTLG